MAFRTQGREAAFSGSGNNTIGEADPWASSRSRYRGEARQSSFIYSTKQTRKNAMANMGHPLANIWEAAPGNRVVKRRIPFLSTFAAKYRRSGTAENIVGEALDNIARDGRP
jgi:hypothetical protein